jgi:hypothetical protein
MSRMLLTLIIASDIITMVEFLINLKGEMKL